MEYVEEAFADSSGEDVVLHTVTTRPDPPQRQEHRQRRAHAEEVLHLDQKTRSCAVHTAHLYCYNNR